MEHCKEEETGEGHAQNMLLVSVVKVAFHGKGHMKKSDFVHILRGLGGSRKRRRSRRKRKSRRIKKERSRCLYTSLQPLEFLVQDSMFVPVLMLV